MKLFNKKGETVRFGGGIIIAITLVVVLLVGIANK